jgi:hypothetical protein
MLSKENSKKYVFLVAGVSLGYYVWHRFNKQVVEI